MNSGNIYLQRQWWKIALLFFAVCIGMASLYYTGELAEKLANEERKKVELWAKGTGLLANPQADGGDLSIAFEVIRNNVTVPVILTDANDNIISHRNLDSSRANHENGEKREAYLLNQLTVMKAQHEPIEVKLYDNLKNYIYYRDSTLLTQLSLYPIYQLAVVALFILISYLVFSTSKKAEQNQVWAGMAKETAHQLGTPLSSLIGCIELLRLKKSDESITAEIEKDVKRLETITERFSSIGSVPKLELNNIYSVLEQSVNYIKARSSKNVHYEITSQANDALVPINVPLFEWVVENVCKNALDAMEGTGIITIGIHSDKKQRVVIDITDSGKGLSKTKFKTIFQPGFTTKARGWGLGLSLSKRIIENYHNGKIFVKSSQVNKGTTFRIMLPLA